jgi:hypothetical protein
MRRPRRGRRVSRVKRGLDEPAGSKPLVESVPKPTVSKKYGPYRAPEPRNERSLNDLVRRIEMTLRQAIVIGARKSDRQFVKRQIEFNLGKLPPEMKEIADKYMQELARLFEKRKPRSR